MILPDPFNLYSFSISRTLPDEYPLVSGGYAEGNGEHLQQQFDVCELVSSQPVVPYTSPLYCGSCGNVNLQTTPNNGQLSFEAGGSATALNYNFNDGLSFSFADTAPAQYFDAFQDLANGFDAPLPLLFPQSMDIPAEVRDFDTEYCVNIQSLLSFPTHQLDPFSDPIQHIWTQSSPDMDNSHTPSNTTSVSTTGETHVSEKRRGPETTDSTNDLHAIARQHSIPCPVCKRRFLSEDGLRHHQSTTSGHTLYICRVAGCPEKNTLFKSERVLTRHHNSVHTPRLSLPCNKVMSNREDNILHHARDCPVCSPRIDDVKKLLGIQGVRKRGRKRKNP